MNKEQTLLLKIGSEGGCVEIFQNSNESYTYHSDESSLKDFLNEDEWEDVEFEHINEYATLEEAIERISLNLFAHAKGILYINPEKEFDIKLAIHKRIKDL